jgi:2,4-dienoyl-CoA reductase-like NADH-dependent reductase (Old Yellow Enzyme family)
MTDLSPLWEPIDIAGVTLRNRVMVSAHDTGFSKDNLLGDRYIAYLADRAKGGAAIVMPGAQVAHRTSGGAFELISGGWRPEAVPQYRKLADAVHEHGGLSFVQMVHWGVEQIGNLFIDEPHELLAPSNVPSFVYGEEPRAMDQEDIDDVIEGFVQTARNVRASGLDGVEIHGAHGYLVCEFLSPMNNHRTDKYGGNTENRCRFALEIAQAVRDEVGNDFPVGIRVSFDEMMPDGGGGITADEGERIVRTLHASGLFTHFNITAGNYQSSQHYIAPMTSGHHGNLVPFAARVKQFSDVPVITVGRIQHIADAADIVRRGDADIVAMTRAHIADPEIVNKAQTGRAEEIRPCVGANQGCINRIIKGIQIQCTQNAAVGREAKWGIGTLTPVDNPQKVVVVGAGPAGLKAAETAALRGHEVVLVEQADEVGGQLRYASRIPLRADWTFVTDPLARSLDRLGVDVRLGTKATADLVNAESPDEVVIATGSRFLHTGYTVALGDRAGIEGLGETVDPIDAIADPDVCGDKVLIVDDKGDYLPLGLAHLLAETGRSVEVVSRHMFVGGEILITGDMPIIYSALGGLGVKLTPQTMVVGAGPGEVTLLNPWNGELMPRGVDSLILCMGKASVNDLYRELRLANSTPVHRIGDCVAPRHVDEAIYEGERAGRAIGEDAADAVLAGARSASS